MQIQNPEKNARASLIPWNLNIVCSLSLTVNTKVWVSLLVTITRNFKANSKQFKKLLNIIDSEGEAKETTASCACFHNKPDKNHSVPLH